MSQATQEKRSLCFYIEGESYTDLARAEALGGDYERALYLLAEGIEGLGYDRAVAILRGTHRMAGTSPRYRGDEGTLSYIEEDRPVSEYLDELLGKWRGACRKNNRYFVPYAVVTNFGRDDFGRGGVPLVRNHPLATSSTNKYNPRATFYADDVEDIGITCRGRKDTEYYESAILFREIEAPPAWLKGVVEAITFDNPDEAKPQWGSALEIRGWVQRFGDNYVRSAPRPVGSEETEDERKARCSAEDEEQARLDREEQERIARLRVDILNQAGADLLVLQVERAEGDDRPKEYVVPAAPFARWSLRNYSRFYWPEWENVAPSGMKMPNDDVNHTDWMIGANPHLDLDSWYKHGDKGDDPLQSAVHEASTEILKKHLPEAKGIILAGGKPEGTGWEKRRTRWARVLQPESPDFDVTRIPKNYVLVVPTADPKYTGLTLGAQAVLTERGGKLCHLATIGRENSVPIIQVRGATKLYQHDVPVQVDLTTGEVRVGTWVQASENDK